MYRLSYQRTINIFWIATFSILLACFLPRTLSAVDGDFRGPWTVERSSHNESALKLEHNKGPSVNNSHESPVSLSPFTLYQKYVTAIDGRDCPSFPSCSTYAVQAVQRFGLFRGTLLAIDRLIHESDQIYRGPFIKTAKGLRLYDPIESNIFWMKKLSPARNTGSPELSVDQKKRDH